MARIRSLHPGQASDEDFVAMSVQARLFCLLLRCHADDQGIFEWKPKTLKMKIFPADNIDVVPLLDDLVANRQIMRFEVGGGSYGAIRNFRKYQRPKKPSNSYPLPDDMRTYVGLSTSNPPPVENQFSTEPENPPQMEDGGGVKVALLPSEPESDRTQIVPREISAVEKSEAVKILEAFDAERVIAFGESRARPWPHALDLVNVERWVTAGATFAVCRPIFAATMCRMAAEAKQPPDTLSFFEKPVANALEQSRKPMPKGVTDDDLARDIPAFLDTRRRRSASNFESAVAAAREIVAGG
jgi:hypothetical protein